MKAILRTSALASLAVVACVFAAPAAAQIRTPVRPVPTPTLPGVGGVGAICVPPSLALCQSAGYLGSTCGKMPIAQSMCESLLGGEYKAQYQGSAIPDSTVFTPPGANEPRTVQVGKRVAFDPLRLQASPKDDTTLAGMLPIFSAVSATADPAGVVLFPKSYVRHPTWATNGTIASCAEYVWEKYYDYSRFEDSARLCGKDLECVYDVAFNRATVQQNGNFPVPGGVSVVVTPGIAHRNNLRRFDGTPMEKIGLHGTLPKNAFFETPTSFLKKKALSGPADVRALYLSIATRLETNPRYAIGAGQTYKDEWTWHESMHDAQVPLGITPGERIAIDWRLARITRLLQEYWQALIAEETGSTPVPIFDPVGSLTTMPGGEIFTAQDPFFFLSSLQSVQTSIAPTTIASALGVTSTELEFSSKPGVTFLPGLAPTPIDTIEAQPMSLRIGGPTNVKVGIVLPPTLTGALPNQSIGDRLAAALIDEWGRPDHGCLGSDNRCDWSPRAFANRFVDLFQHEREHDLDRCLDSTPSKFAPPGAADGPAPTAAERTSSAALEGYFARRAASFGAQLIDVPVLPPSAGGLPRIGKSWVGGNDFGFPDFLGARYNYDVGWEIAAEKMLGNDICRLGARANALLFASVTYPQLAWPPIKTETIVDTNSYVDVRNGSATVHSHFAVLGKDVLYAPFTATLAPDAPKVIPPTSYEQVLLELKKTVIIMGVPVTGALKATASVGFSGKLGAVAPEDCSTTNLATKLTAEFVPTGEARAKAYLMIGIPGIGAGVEGELLIVRAEVPASASVAVVSSGTELLLDFRANAALKLHSLSGRVEAYAELCVPLLDCYRTSTELFAWDGYHQSYPLVNLDKKIPLFALNSAKPK